MSVRPTVKSVRKACLDALAAVGIPRKYDRGVLQLSDGFFAWIGLNTGTHSDFIRINPFVGVHATEVMKVFCAVAGMKWRPGEWATYAVHLGELCPDVQQFIFATEADVPGEAARLAQTIAEFGMPYAKTLCSYDTLLPLLKARVPGLGGAPQMYAVTLALNGELAAAQAFLEAEIGRCRAASDLQLLSELESILAWLPV
ncbi:hypothetical protein [Duganella violaceipulchra]|uniref:DUF4304 domain-containing protein n=1 Tax=Duganella violaceipulchra TaxID=2849652 RepID=A0AA41H8C5_9BURK|nr:hypothetical protein [Duganella violaceicalia]MBV6323962.1 hypothetical protein [Duganella violaceicalia]MCP2011056.1 hypothetical protein [Duganella violaceicalia]